MRSKAEALKFIAALSAVYLLWGSTYLAIKVVVASVPPLLAAGVRFLIAGSLLYGWGILRGSAAPLRQEWKNLLILGALMFFACYSCLFWAEKTLPSGLASVLVATLPMWTLLFETSVLGTQRLTSVLCLALLLGFAGVFVIGGTTGTGMSGIQWLPTLAVLTSVVSWAVGSILSKKLRLPEAKSVSAGGQMLIGGAILLLVSFPIGEWKSPVLPSRAAIAGLAYLIIAGSIGAFGSYVWLLERMNPTQLSSYAYVNPVVALALGYFFGGERFPSLAIVGSGLVLASVVLILNRTETGPLPSGWEPKPARRAV